MSLYIVHSVAKVTDLHHTVFGRFKKFFNSGVLSKSSFVSKIFYDSSCLAYTFIGYNYMFRQNHFKIENSSADVLHVAKLCVDRSHEQLTNQIAELQVADFP